MVHAGNEIAVSLHELLVGYIVTRIVVTEPPIHCSGAVIASTVRQHGACQQKEEKHRVQLYSFYPGGENSVWKFPGIFFNGESS